MKTRTIFFLITAGLITISFTFGNVNEKASKQEVKSAQQEHNEPVGGFVSADKL
jgi:hypothetical protein